MYQNGWFCTSIISKIDFTKILSHRRILFFSTLYVMTYKWKLTKILNLEEKENLQNVHNSRVKKLLLQNLFMVVFMETRAFIFHLYYEDRRSRERYSSPSFSSVTWTFKLPQKFLAPMEKKLRQTAQCSANRRYETHGESFYFHLAFGKLIGYVMDWTRP